MKDVHNDFAHQYNRITTYNKSPFTSLKNTLLFQSHIFEIGE